LDRELRYQVLRAAIRDNAFLRDAWQDLDPEAFSSKEEQAVADVCRRFFEKYGEPVGGLVRTLVEDKLNGTGKWGEESKRKLGKLLDTLLGHKLEPVAVKALIDRVKELKRDTFYERAVEELISSQEQGELTPEKLAELVERANRELTAEPVIAHDYFDEPVRERIKRRKLRGYREYPMLDIEPLDSQIQVIGPGHIGMILAPPGGGKGLCFVHFDIAYVLQGLRVLHFTLEDPIDLVENRLDAALCGIPLAKLKRQGKRVRKAFEAAKDKFRGKLRIVDATDGGWTVSRMERMAEQYKQNGFDADAIIIDYDDEIVCEKQFKGESARRFEFAEIYRRLRRWAKNTNKIVWVAAQTTRQAVGLKVISAKHVAEDYSKVRKVFFAMTIGSDPKRPDVRYLNIVKHRLDKANFGVLIKSKYGSGIFYDPKGTERLQREEQT